jgi:transglutaminase-like putative cysteine protease
MTAPSSPPASRTFWFHYEVEVAEAPSTAVRVWLPFPTADASQDVLEARLSGANFSREREPVHGNEYLFVELPPDTASRTLVMSHLIRRREAVTVEPPVLPAQPLTEEVRRFLLANREVPTDGEVVAEARAVAEAGEPPASACRKVFQHFLKTFEYDSRGCTIDRASELGNLARMCEIGSGTCTDWHGLFVSWMRSLGVPARFHFGFNIPRGGKQSGTIAGYHCWADAWLPEAGWFPVDITEAKKRPEEEARFFGGLDENRVRFTLGRDVALTPAPAEGPVDKFIFPLVEADGRPHRFTVKFRFEAVEQ